jgi:transposase
MEDWVTIRNLRKRNPDLGTRRIAELLGVSRGTVRKALVSEQYPSYRRPSTVSRSIEPFEGFIKESYLVRNQRVSVIFENLRSKVFIGSRISLYRYIADRLKTEKENGRKVAYMPYETLAGEQMLYDWSEYSILFGPELVKVYVHIMELGFSRYRVLSASMTIKQSDVFEPIEDAFHELGGVASRIQVDNARVFVEDASTVHFQWNRRFLDFSGFYGIHPTRSAPGHPWSKAKAEVAVQVVERWILAKLRNATFFSLVELNTAIKKLLTKLNECPFKKLPGSRRTLFESLDRPALKPLPEQPYVYAEWKKARVHIDYHIEVDSHYYSVPYQLVKQQLDVRITQKTLEVFYKGRRVASHWRSDHQGRHTTVKDHMPKAHQSYAEWTPDRLIRWAAKNGTATAKLIETILASRPHPQQGFRSCLGIMRLTKPYGPERLEAACARALAIGAFNFRSVKAILQTGLDRRPLPTTTAKTPAIQHENIRGPHYYRLKGEGLC